jgi:hypothetical protein
LENIDYVPADWVTCLTLFKESKDFKSVALEHIYPVARKEEKVESSAETVEAAKIVELVE